MRNSVILQYILADVLNEDNNKRTDSLDRLG